MNIIVFGANGKIGQHFIQIALQNGDHVKAYVRREGALTMQHPNLETIVGSLTDEQQVAAAYSRARYCCEYPWLSFINES